MKEQVYTAEQIIKKYNYVIEKTLRDYIMDEHDNAIQVICVICRSSNVEYDWKNSPEGFENWLLRMSEEKQIEEKLVNALSGLWDKAQMANKEWQAVYYGIQHVKCKKEA